MLKQIQLYFLVIALSCCSYVLGQNQTETLSPILSEKNLPFDIEVKLLKNKDGSPFLIEDGLQSYVFARHQNKILLLNGRTNGLHGFNSDPNNFPPRAQNRKVYVVDLKRKTVHSRSLDDARSGLTQDQIDSLSVTAAQFYQEGEKLYITGGYGFRQSINQFTTFDVLTAIDVPGLIEWVIDPKKDGKASHFIRQTSDETFRVTGGAMYHLGKDDPTLLVFGQDFEGTYFYGTSLQIYTKQVRPFLINDHGNHLSVKILKPTPVNDNYRRRDLNVVPIIQKHQNSFGYRFGLAALSGVFTVDGGAWTVPVTITSKGKPSMANPNHPKTFKQGMNNYASAFLSLYSPKSRDNYAVILGGITYEYFEDGLLEQDEELPFTNQITTVKLNKNGIFSQYIMKGEYPVVISRQSNPGNALLFGSSASFIPAPGLEELQLGQEIFDLDRIRSPTVVGYIIGGIASTVPNTTSISDTTASPYMFKVILKPKFRNIKL